jgi:hypothetical protein
MRIEDLGNLRQRHRRRRPYAVGIHGMVVRFSDKPAAALYADLLEPQQAVRRFVALTENEYRTNPEIHGWREVTYFALPTTIADLDGTVDEPDWIQVGHVLDADEVAFLRSLRLPEGN